MALVRRGDLGFDGLSRFTFNLAKGFKDLGHEVYVIASEVSSNPRQYFDVDVNTMTVGKSSNFLSLSLKHLLKSSRMLRDLGIDLVITNGAIPLIIDAVKIAVNHGNAIAEYRRSTLARLYGKLVYAMYDTTVCVSSKVKREMESVGIKCQEVIPLPLIINNYNCEHSKDNYVLFVGGDYRRKRLDVAINAVKILRREGFDLTLKVVGPRSAADDYVEFVGGISDKELRELYSRALALIHPSEWEGLPYAVLEAQASCTPVVVGPGVPDEALIHGITGFKVISFDPVDYARAIAKLIRDRDTYRKMSVKAREYAEKFDYIKITREYLRLYHEARR
ncbi:MAG: glycosyltransferase family 4 protein [Vulcanisaeta sp.]